MFNSALRTFAYSSVDKCTNPVLSVSVSLASDGNKLKQSSGQILILLKSMHFLLNDVEKKQYVQNKWELSNRTIRIWTFPKTKSLSHMSLMRHM